MYKNRSRGLKRVASVVGASTSSSSNLGEDKSSFSRPPNLQRSPLKEASRQNVEEEEDDDDVRPPPAKKPANPISQVEKKPTKSTREEPKSQPKPQTQTKIKERVETTQKPRPSRSSRDRGTKSSLLNNCVDIDADTLYAVFPTKFEELVTKSGFKLKDGDEPFLLRKDQAVFVRNLSILLAEKDDNPDEFLEGFEKYIENRTNFRKMLHDTQTDPDFEDARSSQQDSLIRMLLSVESIQPKVIVLLIQKLVELIQRDKKEIEEDEVPWVELIVKRFCFLDQLVDGTALFKDIFRLLQIAPVSVQQEIIYNLPSIMGDAHHDEVAERLLNLMETKRDLTRAVLEALGSLPLSPTQSADIRNQMMQSLKSAPIEFIPDIVKFVALEQCTNHDEIINGLRSSLPFTKLNAKLLAEKAAREKNVSDFHAEFASAISLTFRNLRGAFLSIPSLATAWCKNIKGILSPNDHRPLDIVILLLMHCKASNRRKQVELVWRNRIKTKMFTHTLLVETFQVLIVVLKKYKDDVLNVASILLRNSDISVREYGCLMFKLSFVHFESHIRHQVVSDLILHVGSGDTHAQVALDVLLELAGDHLDKLSRLTILLQNLLDNLDKLSLQSVRQMMDLLCKMAYAPEVVDTGVVGTLGDNISIIVHKQLASFEPMLKRKGVVSAVMMLKYLAAGVSLDTTNQSVENHSLESLPAGRPKEAGNLLDLVMRSTRSSPEVLGYCLDQLSFMIYRCDTLDQLFLQYFVDKMEDSFMASFLSDDSSIPSTSRGNNLELRMTDQYGLDKDSDEPIALGVGVLVLKDARNSKEGSNRQSHDGTYPLLVLNSLFRLLRVLKFRTGDEHLEGIDALLGCAVNMPSHETIVDFNICGPSQQADIVDCLFYCINWFREIINAFSNTKSEAYLEKVMIRLRNLVALQGILSRLLGNTMNYTPPQCMFYEKAKKIQFKGLSDKPKKKGKGKGRKASKKKMNESSAIDESTNINEDSDEEDKDKEEEGAGPVDLSRYRIFLRELDLDVFGLMKEDLVMTPPPERGADSTADLGPAELCFLLEDYVAKLEHSFPSAKASRFAQMKAGGESQYNFAVWDLLPLLEKATNAVSMLPILCEKLEQIGESCRNLLDANDGIIDGPGMFVEGTSNVKICFALILRAMSSTFAWNGFHHSQNSELLLKGLKVLATRLDSSKKRSSVFPLIEDSVDYLKRFHEWILHLDAGVHLVKLLQVFGMLWDINISRISGRQTRVNPTKEILKDVCAAFLRRPWSTLDGALERGTAYTLQVELLARVYFESVEDKLDVLQDLVPKLYTESRELTSKESAFETFPAVSKYNFYVLCRVMYSALAKGIQSEMSKTDDIVQQMKAWTTVFKVLGGMVDITQKFTARPYLAAMLKHGQVLLKYFLEKGMPVLESCLRNNTEEVMAILRSSQTLTRFINKICLSCKTSQDSALTAHVPKIRGTMETILYRVKGMLALNNIESAWHMGNLRNRDVHNVELNTQESNEDDEEVPEEDEEGDADVTLLDSGSDDDEDQRVKGKKKRRQGGKKNRSRRSGSGSEDEDEEDGSGDDEGGDTSISTAY